MQDASYPPTELPLTAGLQANHKGPRVVVGGHDATDSQSPEHTECSGKIQRLENDKEVLPHTETRQGAAQPRAATGNDPTLDELWRNMSPVAIGTSQPRCGWLDCVPGLAVAPASGTDRCSA